MVKFYDTCSLLNLQEDAFKEDRLAVSTITLRELEEIKTSMVKDEETKAKARGVIKLLNKYEDKVDFFVYTTDLDEYIERYSLVKNNDARIAISAMSYCLENGGNAIFVSDDSVCRTIAKQTLQIPAQTSEDFQEEEYLGYKEFVMSEVEMADFYTAYADGRNIYNLLENEYIILKTPEGIVFDKYKWIVDKESGKGRYEALKFTKPESIHFGKVCPKDIYQQLALDSLYSNHITMLRGKAGSGKSLLSFGYMFNLLEHGDIDKIIVFCNTVATRGSAKLGFYPGSRTEKLLDSQIGNLLVSKVGSRVEVERLIDDEKLELLPFSDIRGYDTTGMHAAIYISEAQNLDKELMKLALQRIGDDCICIIDGDDKAQVDMAMYAGANNGMKRVSKVFRGESVYGEVTLQNIYRSKIADIADKL